VGDGNEHCSEYSFNPAVRDCRAPTPGWRPSRWGGPRDGSVWKGDRCRQRPRPRLGLPHGSAVGIFGHHVWQARLGNRRAYSSLDFYPPHHLVAELSGAARTRRGQTPWGRNGERFLRTGPRLCRFHVKRDCSGDGPPRSPCRFTWNRPDRTTTTTWISRYRCFDVPRETTSSRPASTAPPAPHLCRLDNPAKHHSTIWTAGGEQRTLAPVGPPHPPGTAIWPVKRRKTEEIPPCPRRKRPGWVVG